MRASQPARRLVYRIGAHRRSRCLSEASDSHRALSHQALRIWSRLRVSGTDDREWPVFPARRQAPHASRSTGPASTDTSAVDGSVSMAGAASVVESERPPPTLPRARAVGRVGFIGRSLVMAQGTGSPESGQSISPWRTSAVNRERKVSLSSIARRYVVTVNLRATGNSLFRPCEVHDTV